jgi:hypothetical protein
MKLGGNNGGGMIITATIEPNEQNKESWIGVQGKKIINYGETPVYHGKI